MAAVFGDLTVAELIQIGLGAPAAVKALVDVAEEVKAMNLAPTDPVPPAHAARARAAMRAIFAAPSTDQGEPSAANFAEGGQSL